MLLLRAEDGVNSTTTKTLICTEIVSDEVSTLIDEVNEEY